MKKFYLLILFSVCSQDFYCVSFLVDAKAKFQSLHEQELRILEKKKGVSPLYSKKLKEEKERFVGLCILYKIYYKDLARLNMESNSLKKRISGEKEDLHMIDGKLRSPGLSEERPLLLIEKDAMERRISGDINSVALLINRYEDVNRMLMQTKEKLSNILDKKRKSLKTLKEF
jgi:hypothetical protein